MYTFKGFIPTTLSINETEIGESIEEKVDRILNNGEPITDGADAIYTERKDGVLPEYNPRTNRIEIALEAMDSVARDKIAQRESRLKIREDKEIKGQNQEGQSQGADGTNQE